MNQEKKIKKRKPLNTASRIACGIVAIAAAVLVLLSSFGIITLGINIGILVAIAAIAVIAIYSAFHFFWAGFFFLAATIIVIMNANGLYFDLEGSAIGGLYIAAALLTVAFHLFFRKSVFGISIGSDHDATFGSATRYIEDEFEFEKLECNFGSIKAFLEQAKPKNGHATIDVECNFGGIEIYVPKTWKVIDRVTCSFGNFEQKNRSSTSEKSPTLTITGECSFGAVTVVYI